MNLRGSFNQTLARPSFKEKSVSQIFDPISKITFSGNIDLKETYINNFDFRWEYFFKGSEMVSVSTFYKTFEGHIELVAFEVAPDNIKPRNSGNSMVYGTEFEFRKNLDFITPALKDLRASGNITLIKSRLDISPDELEQIRSLNPNAESTRAMFGQSPYSLNGELAYTNDSIGFNTSMSFNVFGPRIAAVSRGGTPNVYEQPRPTLDFSVGKRFGPIDIRFRARNLLDPEYKKVQTLKNVDYIFSSYRIGRTFSLGVTYTIQ